MEQNKKTTSLFFVSLIVSVVFIGYFALDKKFQNKKTERGQEIENHQHPGQSATRISLMNIFERFNFFKQDDSSVWDKWVLNSFSDEPCVFNKERDLYPKSYTGPLIDTHIHIASIPDDPSGGFDRNTEHPTMGVNITIDDLVCMMDTEGTKSVFAFFPVWDPITEPSIQIVKKADEKYPGRFAAFIMPPDHDNDPGGFPTVKNADLEKMLAIDPGVFEGYGEIGLYKRKGGAAALPPDSLRLQDIYPTIRENKLLVYFHLGEGQKENFERVLDANPDINFIWHGDQLVKYERNGRQNLSAIDDILSRHPNVYYGVDELYGDIFLLRPEVSKEEFLAHFKNYEPLLKKDLATWKKFIEKHPNRVLWGTDRGWSSSWSVDQDVALVLNRYSRAFIGRLDPKVQENFAYKNAEHLLSQAGLGEDSSGDPLSN